MLRLVEIGPVVLVKDSKVKTFSHFVLVLNIFYYV